MESVRRGGKSKRIKWEDIVSACPDRRFFFSVIYKGEQKVACPRIKAVLKIFYMEYLNVLRCWAVYAREDFLT